jgi:Txe/YoeB family toxin of Txe-Axe toxin-antitoxin module
MTHSAEDMNQTLAHPVTKLHSDNIQQDPYLNIHRPENLEYHYHKSISHTPTNHFII